jgi:hypothetical protein
MPPRHWFLLAALALALAAPAAAAPTGSGEPSGRAPFIGSNAGARPPLGHFPILAPIQLPQLPQRTAFSLFRTPPDTPPPAIAASLEAFAYRPAIPGTGKTLMGLNPKLAQLARGSTKQGPSVWVVPGRGFLQIWVAPDPSSSAGFGSTATTRRALREGIAAGQGANGGRGPDIHWVGIVPDDVFAVRLGPHTFARVRKNVYEADARLNDLDGHFRLLRRNPHLAHASDARLP